MRGGVSKTAFAVMMLCMAGCPNGGGGGPPGTNIEVSAGDDQTLFVGETGTATAVVTGATGNVNFQWTITPPGVIVGSAAAETVSFGAPSAGTATLTVAVSDSGTNTSATDELAATFQTPPLTVSAGPDGSVAAGDTILLTAKAAGGVPPYSFQWTRTSGPAQPISPPDGKSNSITVAGSAPGTVGFQIAVTDSTNTIAVDDLLLTVVSAASGVTFTLGQDDLTGTDNSDIFRAPALDPASSGSFAPTLQTGDKANGLGDSDVLNATFAGPAGPAIVPAAISAIETINRTDIATGGSQSISAVNSSGVTTINSVASTNSLVLIDVPALVNLGLIDARAGLNVKFLPAVVAGTTDSISLTLSNVSAGSVELSGVEILNLASTVAPNTLGSINGNAALKTINASGNQPLVITNPLPEQVTTFSAAAATGGVRVGLGQADARFVGGTGDDAVSFLQFGAGDIADGGAGHDALRITAADAIAVTSPLLNVAGFEELGITTVLTGDVNASLFGSTDTLRLEAGVNATPARSLTVRAGTNVILQGEISGATPGISIVSAGSATVTVDSSAQSPAGSPDPLLQGLGYFGTITDARLVLLGNGPDRIINAISVQDIGSDIVEALTITGNIHLTTQFVTVDKIDASGLTGGLRMLPGTTTASVIIGTPGYDELRGSYGVDTITLGSGADLLFLNFAGANGVDRKIVTDFDDTPGTGDTLVFDPAVFPLSGTDNFSSPASIQDASGTVFFPKAATELIRFTGHTLSGLTSPNSLNGTNLLAAINGGIVVIPDHAYLFAIESVEPFVISLGQTAAGFQRFNRVEVGIYYGRDVGGPNGEPDAQIKADELTLVAVLQGPNVSLANLVFENFSN